MGQFFAKSGAQRTLAERWNGRDWQIQPTPNPARSSSSSLFAVSCPTADSCTAVGSSASKLLVERWGGSKWRIQPAPVPPGAQFSELNGVSCTATSCVAVGDYVNSSGVDVTLAERWNGTKWTIQHTPNPSGAHSFDALTGVSCLAGGACEASGASDAGMFAERWNGTSWSLQAVPAPTGAQFALLFNVSCAASSCEAVGGYVDSSGAFVTVGERWNGAAWRAQSTPNPARASTNYLGGVSCPSSADCTAVGQGNGDGTPITLGARWRDGRWRLQAVPSPVGAAENQLNGVACPTTDRCVAVGAAGPTRGVVSTEALWWNGRTWHLQPIPTPPGRGQLNGVSCTSPSACTAVGTVFDSSGNSVGTLVEQWNGTRWRIQPTPTSTSAGAFLNGVSCTSPSACTAVGNTSSGLLAERWNGTKWRIQPVPTPSAPQLGFLTGVSCTGASACTAVGGRGFDSSGNSVGTIVERWNGQKWRIQPTPTSTSPGYFLSAVWCTSSSVCTAVGNSSSALLAERWNGSAWTVQATPVPPGTKGQGDFFNSVSCTSPSACTATGLIFFSPSAPATIAERWNGMSWRIQPTPLLPGAHDISPLAVACPASTACIAVGGYENDGPGSKTLAERWQRSGTSTAQTAPRAFSSRAYQGIAGCIRGAIGKGFAIGAPTRVGPNTKAAMPQQPQPASEIERITSLCSTA